MVGKEMFPHLLTWNPPNLVEMKQKQNKLQIFIDNSLSYKKFMKNALQNNNFLQFSHTVYNIKKKYWIGGGGRIIWLVFLRVCLWDYRSSTWVNTSLGRRNRCLLQPFPPTTSIMPKITMIRIGSYSVTKLHLCTLLTLQISYNSVIEKTWSRSPMLLLS